MSALRRIFHDAIIWTMIFLLGPWSLISCSNDLFGVNELTGITISKTLMEFESLDAADSVQTLEATVTTKGGSTLKDVRWSVEGVGSSQAANISILNTANGTIQFRILQAGEYRITAIANGNEGLKATCVIRVKGYLESLDISHEKDGIADNYEVTAGASFKLLAVYTPESTSQTDVIWRVQDQAIATIGEKTGEVTAHAPGSTVITVTSVANPSITSSVNLLVKAAIDDQDGMAARINVAPTSMEIPIHTSEDSAYMLSATVIDGFQNTVVVGEVEWTSSDTMAVQVVKNGSREAYVNSVGRGEAEITAKFVDPRYPNAKEITATVPVKVTGALESIGTTSSTYGFPTNMDTSRNENASMRIPLEFVPDTTTDTAIDIVVEDESIARVTQAGDGTLNVLTFDRTGATGVTVSSLAYPDIYCEFVINVTPVVTKADRVQQVSVSRSVVEIEPPFESNTVNVTATTKVFDAVTGNVVDGSASEFPVSFESMQPDIARIRSTSGNTATLEGVEPGETVIVVSSDVNPDFSAEIQVSVTGELEGIVSPVDNISIRAGEEGEYRLSANPWNAIITTDRGEPGALISARTEGTTVLQASVEIADDSSNEIILTLTGINPGTETVTILADGEEMADIRVNVLSREDYITKLAFESPSVIMRQDADGRWVSLEASNIDGGDVDVGYVGNGYNVTYQLIEGGRTYDEGDFGRSKVLSSLQLDGDHGRVYFAPKNSGSAIIKAFSTENPAISAELYVEVGGAPTKGGALNSLRPENGYMQVRLGGKVETGVNFIPVDYADKNVDWEVMGDDADGQNVEIVRELADGRVQLKGLSVGKDTVVATARGGQVNTQFTVEVVDGDAWAITLDRHYLSYDRNQKADPVITAYVTKNGNPDSSRKVEWEIKDMEDAFISITKSGSRNNAASVHLLDNDNLGTAYVTASIEGVDNVFTSCLVEAINSYSADAKARSLNLSYSSITLERDDSIPVPYTLVPEEAAPYAKYEFDYTTGGVVEMSYDKDLDVFILEALSEGTTTVTATVSGTGVEDTIDVNVIARALDPDHIRITVDGEGEEDGYFGSINLDQEYMDSYRSIKAEVVSRDGTVLDSEEVMKDISFSVSNVASRYFSSKTASDHIDTSKGPADGLDYWGTEEIAANEIRIKPVGAGTASIRVSYPGLRSVTLTVTVAAEEAIYQEGVSELLGSTSKAVVETGGSQQIWVTAVPDNDLIEDVSWTSSRPDIVSVKADAADPRFATITGVSTGTTTVKASIDSDEGERTATFAVQVVEDTTGMLTGMSLLPQHVIFDLDAKKLTVLTAGMMKNGQADAGELFSWDVDESLVSETEEGRAIIVPDPIEDGLTFSIEKGTKEGSGYITATSVSDPSFHAKAYVEVIRSSTLEKILSRVLVNTEYKEMEIGETFSITASPIPSSIATEDGWNVTYRSANDRIASVSSTGEVRALRAGNTQIVVTGSFNDRLVSTNVNITVNAALPAASIVLSDDIVELGSAIDSTEISVDLYDAQGNSLTDEAEFDWVVEDSSVASIEPVRADDSSVVRVSAKRMDAATRFTVSSSRISAEGYIVVGTVDELVGIIINPASISMSVNEKVEPVIRVVPESLSKDIEVRADQISNDTIDVEVTKAADTGISSAVVTAEKQGSASVVFNAYERGVPTGHSTTLSVNVSGVAVPMRIELDRDIVDFSRAGKDVVVNARVVSSKGGEYAVDENTGISWSLEGTPDMATVTVDPDVADKSRVTVSRSKADGDMELIASYENLKASIDVVDSSKIVSDATRPSSLVAKNDYVILYHPDTVDPAATDAEKRTVLEALYQPDNLASQYKGLEWSFVTPGIVTYDDTAGQTSLLTDDGLFPIKAVGEGTTQVIARSEEDPRVEAVFSVTVLPEGTVIEGGIPEITLDKASITIEAGGAEERIQATVTNDEGEVDDYADRLEWNVLHGLATHRELDENSIVLTSGDKAGYDTLQARYMVVEGQSPDDNVYVSAKAPITVQDSSVIGQDLRDVSLSTSELVMVRGRSEIIPYTVTPNLPVELEFAIDDDGIVEVEESATFASSIEVTAKAAGEALVQITAREAGVDDGAEVVTTLRVTVTNTIPASAKYSSFTPSATVVEMMPSDPATLISYELIKMDDGEEDLDADIYEINVVGVNGDVLQTIDHDQIVNGTPNGDNGLFDISWYGQSNTRSISIDPKAPGAAYLEVTVADDPNAMNIQGITARTFVSIGGTLKSLSIPTQYIHMAVGDRESVSISFNPVNALINPDDAYFTWTANDGLQDPVVQLIDETAGSVTIQALKVGETTLSYSYDGDGAQGPAAPKTAEVKILVDSRDMLAGGARKVSFPTSWLEIPYPYEKTNVAAEITFFDGSTTSEEISYGFLRKDAGGQDMKFEDIDTDTGNLSLVDDIGVITYATGMDESGIWIDAKAPGRATLVAYYKDGAGNDHIARMTVVTGGAVEDIILSNSTIVLYTGGSMVLTAEVDDPNAPGVVFNWAYGDETDSNGNKVTSNLAIQTPITLNNSDGSSVIVAARDVITNPNDDLYDATLANSYPREGKITVSLPQYPGVTKTINVRVEPLPEENTYPKEIQLSATRLTLEPDAAIGGFAEDQEMSATVTDRDGNEVRATVDWYYYPISKTYDWTKPADSEVTNSAGGGQQVTAEGLTYKFQSWLDPEDVSVNRYVEAFMQEDTSVLYYKPQSAGQYRLKAVVRENPILQAECTITVGGEVRSISADTGPALEMTKGASQIVNAVYTPENALARDIFWIPEEFKDAALSPTNSTADREAVVNTSTDKYSFTQNGNSISLRANELTDEAILYLEYWDSDVTGALNELKNLRGEFTAEDYRKALDAASGVEGDGLYATPILSYPITIRINSPEKTIVSFTVNGLSSAIDPSSLESGGIEFSLSANMTGGSQAGGEFTDWDWIEVDIVGAETNYVYATTRLIDDPQGAITADGQKKKVADWQYYIELVRDGQNFKPSIAEPLAVNGRIFRDGGTFSFQLNQNGLTTEPLYVVCRLIPEYADGYKDGYSPSYVDENAGSKLGEYLFNVDLIGFNEGRKLVTIGGAVTSISQGESYFNLNGTDNMNTPAGTSNIDLILGASARLSIVYNPTFTHQKGVFWYVASGTFNDFEAMQGGNQCSVFARTETKTPVVLRAVSIYDPWFISQEEKYGEGWLQEYLKKAPSEHVGDEYMYPPTEKIRIYTDYQVTVRSPIQKAVFTSYSQTRANAETDGSGMAQAPLYDYLNEADFPTTEGENEIWCYDTVGASGSMEDYEKMNPVDAYFIETDLIPDYQYELGYRIVQGAEIGSLDFTQIDDGKNQFRFVPRGVVPDIIGNGFTVNYGDVIIEAYNSELNFSKQFTLHYTPSNMKLVKFIGDKERDVTPEQWIAADPTDDIELKDVSTVPEEWETTSIPVNGTYEMDLDSIGQWDVAKPRTSDAANTQLYGMETIILYPGEKFDLSVVSFFNNTPQYVGHGVFTEVGKDMTKYAVQFATKSNTNPSTMNNLVTGYLDFESGYFDPKDYGTEDAGKLARRSGENDESEYEAVNRTNDTGMSNWFYNDASYTIVAKDKQGAFYLQYSIAPLVDPPLDEETGEDPPLQADIGNKITSGVWVYIVDPVDQVLTQVVQRNAGMQSTNIAVEIPRKVSVSQITAQDEDGNPLPSHWFMGVRGAVEERAVDDSGAESDSTVLYRGRAYASFSDDVTISDPQWSGKDFTAIQRGFSEPIVIDSSYISAMNAEYDTSQNMHFLNDVKMTDIGFFGDYGINRYKGIKAIEVYEDGSMTKAFLDTGRTTANGDPIYGTTLDLSSLNVKSYKHTGLASAGSGFNGDTIGEYVDLIRPPHQVEYLDLSGNGLSCSFAWDSNGTGATTPYDIRDTLVELRLDESYFPSLTLDDFTKLRSVSVARFGSWDGTWSRWEDALEATLGKDGESWLNIVYPNSTPSLTQLNLDNTMFNNVVAEFAKGTEEEFLTPGLSRPGSGELLADKDYMSILSARYTYSGQGAGPLKTLNLSGAIGYVDVSSHLYFREITHGSKVEANRKDVYIPKDGYEDFIQIVNLGGPGDLPYPLSDPYVEAYEDEEGIFRSELEPSNPMQGGPSYNLSKVLLNTVGYLTSSNSAKVLSAFDFNLVQRMKENVEEGYGGEDFVDFTMSNPGAYLKSVDFGTIGANTRVAFNNSTVITSVTADNVYGTLELKNCQLLKDVVINSGMSAPPGSALVLDYSGSTDLSRIKANVEALSLNDIRGLTEIVITNGDTNLRNIKELSVNSTPGGAFINGQMAAQGSIITRLEIGSGIALEKLECYGGQSLQTVNIQAENLKHIDLHNTGLYGKSWTIGNFTFLSSDANDNFDGYKEVDDDETPKGMSLSNKAYVTYKFKNVRRTTSVVSTTPIRYEWEYEIEATMNESIKNKNIDWHNWLPGLSSEDSQMILYGNDINFRYFIGAEDVSMGQAADRGLIPMDKLEFEPAVTVWPINGGWIPTARWYGLSDSEKAAVRNTLSSGEEHGWYFRTINSSGTVQSGSIFDSPQNSGNSSWLTYFEAPAESALVVTVIVPDNPGQWWGPSHEETRPWDGVSTLKTYFTWYPGNYEETEDISSFAYKSGDTWVGQWRDEPFQSDGRNSEENAYFSIRFGNFTYEDLVNNMYNDGSRTLFVHNKWKGKAGLTGWFSQNSRGTFYLSSVEGGTMEGNTFSSYEFKEGNGTRIIDMGVQGEMKGRDGAYTVHVKKNGQTVSPAGLKLNFHLYDQTTKSAGHNGQVLVFPFGR